MKKINCEKHGEVIAVCTDSILLRYNCVDCEQEKNDNKDKDGNII